MTPRLFASLLFTTAALAADPTHSAVCDVGSKGCKLVILTPTPVGAPRVVWSKTADPTPLANQSADGRMTGEAVNRTAEAVADLLRAARREYDLPDARVRVVGSSGVEAAANRDDLAAALLVHTALPIRFLTTTDEAILVHKGLVPAGDKFTAMTLDVGSGNTRVAAAGYSADLGEWYAHGTLPAGSVSLAARADRVGGSWADGLAAERAEVKKLAETLAGGHPTLVHHRPKCYLSGGAAWATAAAIRPAAVRDAFVPLSVADLRAFERRLADADGWPAVAFDDIRDPAVRAEAEVEWRRVKDTFRLNELRAGVAVLTAVADAYLLDEKEVSFVRNGQFAWATALAAEALLPPPAPSPPLSFSPCAVYSRPPASVRTLR